MNSEKEEDQKAHIADVTALETYDLMKLFVGILIAQAWQHLGLRVRPGTDKVDKDLERAQVSIDCIAFLIEKLEPHVTDQEIKEMKRALADLQINFARIRAEG